MPLGLERELVRLRAQALITWPKEARNLAWWGLRDGMSVLELGSGPGFVPARIARLVPSGTVVSLDVDPVLIEAATRHLRQEDVKNAAIVEADVMALGLPDDVFDFVYSRYLFQHLPDPVGAAREALRVLKPGGRLAVTDVDDALEIFDPSPTGEAERLQDRVDRAFRDEQARKGGNRFVGRRLVEVLLSAGFDAVDIEAAPAHSSLVDMGDLVPPPTRVDMQHLVDRGILDERELNVLLEWGSGFHASDHVILFLLVMVCGRTGDGVRAEAGRVDHDVTTPRRWQQRLRTSSPCRKGSCGRPGIRDIVRPDTPIRRSRGRPDQLGRSRRMTTRRGEGRATHLNPHSANRRCLPTKSLWSFG